MKHLSRAQLEQLDAKLRVRLQELREDIRRELLQSDQEHFREVAGMVTDAGDESVANLIAELDAAAIERDVQELRELEAACRRLQAGAYGACVDCEEGIPWQRLMAEPGALRCLACAEKHESTHAHRAAPKL
jgi:RNA polymerase-binding transcription factor DksA